MNEFTKFVGLDTHQDTIAVAVSEASGGAARYYGEISNTPKALAKLVKSLTAKGAVWLWDLSTTHGVGSKMGSDRLFYNIRLKWGSRLCKHGLVPG